MMCLILGLSSAVRPRAQPPPPPPEPVSTHVGMYEALFLMGERIPLPPPPSQKTQAYYNKINYLTYGLSIQQNYSNVALLTMTN